MNGLRSALVLLSIYPVKIRDLATFSYRNGLPFYGWAGLLVALPVFLLVMFLQYSVAASALALMALAVSTIITRMMHWDGLADAADAWWGGATIERRLEIMRDSSTGAFAIITLVIVAMGTYLALERVIITKHFLVLLVVPMLARLVVVVAVRYQTPAKDTGLAAQLAGTLPHGGRAVLFSSLLVALLFAAMTTGFAGVVAGLLTLVFGLWIARIIARRMGGLTGDVLGATIALTEFLGYCVFMILTTSQLSAPIILS